MKVSHLFRSAGLLMAVLAFSGCTGAMSDLIIPIDPINPPALEQGQGAPAAVEVVDLRHNSTMRRTTIGDISLGAIALSPPEAELVKELVTSAAMKTGATMSPKIYCGIKIFDIVTPATALYWDVTTRIELILRVGGQERLAHGEAVERTYVYPSEEIIKRVATGALRQVAEAVDKVLPELLPVMP